MPRPPHAKAPCRVQGATPAKSRAGPHNAAATPKGAAATQKSAAATPLSATLKPPRSEHERRTRAILGATLEEIARVGYAAFSVEVVATRVGIAKTTIYRRYGTKLDLARAAAHAHLAASFGEAPDTGTLRGDLVALGLRFVTLMSTALWQALVRMRLTETTSPELAELAKNVDMERMRWHQPIADRAIARGEVKSVLAVAEAIQLLGSTVLTSVLVHREVVEEPRIGYWVDLILHGIKERPMASRRSRRA